MGISKHGRIFWLDVRIRGKRIRRSLRTENRNIALDRYSKAKDALMEEYETERIRFKDFCNKYLEWAWSTKPASTLREQQRLKKINDFFSELGIKYMDEITPFHIDQLKAELKKTGLASDPKKARGLSKTTINRYLQILRGLFYRAKDWELYGKENPVKKVRFYKEDTEIKPLTEAQVAKVLEEAENISREPLSPLQENFYKLIILGLNTGMRKSEILNLKWRDIREGNVEVRGKGDKRRVIPLNKIAKSVIEKQARRNEFVFHIPNRHQHDLFRRTIGQIRKRTGVPFNFHQLRHRFATSLIEKGVDLITIQNLLGHSKMMISLLYSHTDSEKKEKAVRLLE